MMYNETLLSKIESMKKESVKIINHNGKLRYILNVTIKKLNDVNSELSNKGNTKYVKNT
jgi:hypothetical protein